MIQINTNADPRGSYLLVKDGDFSALASVRFDLILSAFAFDNIPGAGKRAELLRGLQRLLNDDGRIMLLGPDGTLYGIDGETYQIDQERGLIVTDSPDVGLVAVLPVGMCFVSSVNLTPEVGASLQKDDEFGFFVFGGSDIVMLFQNKKVVIDAEVGRKICKGSASASSANFLLFRGG